MLIRSFSSATIQIYGKMMALAFYVLEVTYFVLHQSTDNNEDSL